MAGGELGRVGSVAPRTIPRRHNGGDEGTIMVKDIGVARCGLVALDAADPLLRVSARTPMVDDARGLALMTLNARLGAGGDGDPRRGC